ncbi:MAG: HD domain-containing phosphohydrolase [Phycisphaerae bacterium]
MQNIHTSGCEPGGAMALAAIAEAAAMATGVRGQRADRNASRDAVIFALAKLAEQRDPETGAHLERVQRYCGILAHELAQSERYREFISPEYIAAIIRSSPLHDIGKVGVPDSILLKPGRLTSEEFEVMKRHATIGGQTIQALIDQGRSQSYLRMGMEIAYAHHERWDGRGYPAGLSGEMIPLAARIVAVADVYDALTSKRVYKPALSHIDSTALIMVERGRQFDPLIVDAFLVRAEEFDAIRRELADSARAPAAAAPRSAGRAVDVAARVPLFAAALPAGATTTHA